MPDLRSEIADYLRAARLGIRAERIDEAATAVAGIAAAHGDRRLGAVPEGVAAGHDPDAAADILDLDDGRGGRRRLRFSRPTRRIK